MLKVLFCDDKARKDKGPLFNILIPTWKVTNERSVWLRKNVISMLIKF